MKKIIAFFLLMVLLIPLVSCSSGTKYTPVESTASEKRVVMTLTLGDKSYDVRYELYRALFLTYRDEVSLGNNDVWVQDGKEAYVDKINTMILDKVTAIYSVFAVCEDIGVNLYSASVDRQVDEYIATSIAGEDGDGTYEEYLVLLNKMYLNWSVQDLLLRYAIGLEAIDAYYIGDFDAENIGDSVNVGNLSYTREDIKAYYNSDECIRILRAHIQASAHYEPDKYAETVRRRMAEAAPNEKAVATVIINTGLTAATEVMNGYVIGKYNLDSFYYGDLTKAAFALSPFTVSDPVRVHNGDDDIIFIIYHAEKSDTHFDRCYTEIAYVYLTDQVGKIITEAAESLKMGVEYTDVFSSFDYSAIDMDEEKKD